MKVYLDCLACEQRKLDAQRVVDYLKANSIEQVSSPKNADLVIMITCAVDTANEKACVDRIVDLKKQMKKGKLIIGGCLPSINPGIIRELGVDTVFTPKTLELLDKIISPTYKKMGNIPYPNKSVFDLEKLKGESTSPRDEYTMAKNGFRIKIDEGCLGDCTYCVIRRATGALISAPFDEIMWQFKSAVKKKRKQITLMGGDTGAYGIDICHKFFELLSEMIMIPGDYKIYIHDFNVRWIIQDIEEYVRVFKDNEQLGKIRIANIPIQSGSDKILSMMKRHHTNNEAVQAIQSIKAVNPSLLLGTHVIIGFPWESERDFEDTITMLNLLNFDFISCFEYSKSPFAQSANFPNEITKDVIDKRMEKMKTLFIDKVKIYRV